MNREKLDQNSTENWNTQSPGDFASLERYAKYTTSLTVLLATVKTLKWAKFDAADRPNEADKKRSAFRHCSWWTVKRNECRFSLIRLLLFSVIQNGLWWPVLLQTSQWQTVSQFHSAVRPPVIPLLQLVSFGFSTETKFSTNKTISMPPAVPRRGRSQFVLIVYARTTCIFLGAMTYLKLADKRQAIL